MRRGRVELKRIENKINRQVTFAKRKKGLLKKATELSVLCDAEVALIIFSNRGKQYEFCSSSSMTRTLERYQKCKYGPPEPNVPSRDEALAEFSSQQEYLKLKESYDALQRTQKNLLGEELGPLSTKELESLERRLDSSLKKIIALRTQLMIDQINDLQNKLANGYQMPLQLNQIQDDHVDYGRHDQQQHFHHAFFQPLASEPILQNGYQWQQDHGMEAGPSVNNMWDWLPYDANSI
ncbi:hypothetical protein HA466_0266050 [Hirschfeldia incana]|nr:hypothetical protein HA466_0266050 [Hirschfeldia incana]